jgi:uncharacterized protein YuzE
MMSPDSLRMDLLVDSPFHMNFRPEVMYGRMQMTGEGSLLIELCIFKTCSGRIAKETNSTKRYWEDFGIAGTEAACAGECPLLPVQGELWREAIFATSYGKWRSRAIGGCHCISYQQDQKILERAMKVKYHQDVDVLNIRFSDAPVDESDEEKPGIILDYDKDGNLVGIEILNASRRMEDPRSLEYAVA